jgi:hypothetical protein
MAKGQYIQPLSLEKAKGIITRQILNKIASEDITPDEESKLIAALPKVKKCKNAKELSEALGNGLKVLNLLIQ